MEKNKNDGDYILDVSIKLDKGNLHYIYENVNYEMIYKQNKILKVCTICNNLFKIKLPNIKRSKTQG